MAHVKAAIAAAHYAVSIDAGGHTIVSDEPKAKGGENAGPAPYELLLAALAACTAITLRKYAERKHWDLRAGHVDLQYLRDGEHERILRKLRLEGDMTDEQRARFADIAERTPVTLTLKRGLSISTELVPPLASARHAAEVDARLDEALAESFPACDSPRVTP
jgi:putative redox protein